LSGVAERQPVARSGCVCLKCSMLHWLIHTLSQKLRPPVLVYPQTSEWYTRITNS